MDKDLLLGHVLAFSNALAYGFLSLAGHKMIHLSVFQLSYARCVTVLILCYCVSFYYGTKTGLWPASQKEKNTLFMRGFIGCTGETAYTYLIKNIDIATAIVTIALSVPLTVVVTHLYGKKQPLISYLFSFVEVFGIFLVVLPDMKTEISFKECKFIS